MGCSSEGSISSLEGSSSVTLTLNGLQPLPGALNYQAWLVSGSTANYFGYPLILFDIDEEGRMVDPVADTVLTGPFHAGLDAENVLGMGISLELSDQLLTYSSSTFILSGPTDAGGMVDLSAEDWLAFNVSMAGVAGGYSLGTPTDDDPDDELSGIWFINPGTDPAQAGLVLPEAPEGWIYESWVVLQDQTLSMGRFTFPDGADSLSAYSGPLAVPAYPGEDFLTSPPGGLTFPTDLSGASVFVTMEPWEEWDVEPEAPFFIRILEAQVPGDAQPQTFYEMVSLTGQLPSGSAVIVNP
jgi:hypothetical protein